MSRREMREQLFKLLFRVEFNPREELAQQENVKHTAPVDAGDPHAEPGWDNHGIKGVYQT